MNRIAVLARGVFLGCLLAAALPLAASAQQGAQASLEQRIQRMEEHLLDLNSMIGTLQSMVSQGAAANPGGAAPMAPPQVAQPGTGDDAQQRLDAMETQIRALTGQMEQMGRQISQMQASLGGSQYSQQGDQAPGQQQPPQPWQGAPQAGQDTFGQTSVQPNQDGQQSYQQPQSYANGQYDGAQPQQNDGASAQTNPWLQNSSPPQQQRQASIAPSADSQAAYDAAYNSLLQRDFASAEDGFRQFLQSHPEDPLAGNAQYWLGETYYVRGKYREAADSFLAGYRKYRDSDKAPANLLKLGMALNQLGEKDAACSTFSELSSKFPNAPSHLKQRANSESERSGC